MEIKIEDYNIETDLDHILTMIVVFLLIIEIYDHQKQFFFVLNLIIKNKFSLLRFFRQTLFDLRFSRCKRLKK